MTATVPRVARPRGEVTPIQRSCLDRAAEHAEQAQAAYREMVVRVLSQGASFAEVSKVTGLSTNTLQRWKREARRTR